MDLRDTVVILNRPEKHFLGSFYFHSVKKGVDDALAGSPYQVLLSSQDSAIIESLAARPKKLNGVIALAPHTRAATLQTLEDSKLPSVLVNCRSDKMSWVDVDNVHAAAVMTEHLIGLGHRRILCVTGFPDSQNSIDRLRGYRRALEQHAIAYDPQLVMPCDFSITLAYERMKGLLSRDGHPPFTAVFAANDLMAVGVIRALADHQIRVPEDIAVAGFDDFEFSAQYTVPLTTYRQPFRNIGFSAARILLKQLEGGFDRSAQFELIGEIVIRDSCGARRVAAQGSRQPVLSSV